MRWYEAAILFLLALAGVFGLLSLKLYNEKALLEKDVQSLVEENSNLRFQLNSVRNEKESLESQLQELRQRLNEVLGRPEQESRLVIDNEVVTIPARDIWQTTIYADRPGIIVVSYQASGNIRVGLAWEHGQIQYADEKDAGSSGTVAFPVLPTNAVLYIVNPAILSGVTVTLTVEYVYWT